MIVKLSRSLLVVAILVALFAFAGLASANSQPSGQIVDVEVGGPHGLRFSPDVVTIAVGDTVRWTNLGGFHNVNSDDGFFTSGPPSSAPWVFETTFTTAGQYGYHCQPHQAQGMVGTVIVEAPTAVTLSDFTAGDSPVRSALPLAAAIALALAALAGLWLSRLKMASGDR